MLFNLQSPNVYLQLLNGTGFTALEHFLHPLFCLFGFLVQILLGSNHNLTSLYFFPFRLKCTLNLFEKMLKLIIMSDALIILIFQLLVKILQLFDYFLLICILFLQRNDVFVHFERFYLKRSFVLETLIDFILLICWCS